MKIRVVVSYANHSQISSMTRCSLEGLSRCRDMDIEIVMAQGSNIVRNRNASINGERSFAIHQRIHDFDYLLSLDSDVGFKIDHVRQLLAHGLDIVGGAYQKRNRIDLMCSGFWYRGIAGLTTDELCPKWDEEGLKKVDWTGSGFLLLRKEVLEKMEYPWFRYEIVRTELNGQVQQLVTSDDLGFDMNAARAGYDIHLDCSCKIEHLALKTGGVIADLAASQKQEIVAEELEKIEKEIYRTALQLQARGNTPPNGSQEIAARLKQLRDTKAAYVAESERVRRMTIFLD
jgi:hypothetical protein